MAAFPSPAAGHEEKYIGDSLHEHIIRKPSVTRLVPVDRDFERMNLRKGDIAVIEIDRRPHDKCLAMVNFEGDSFLCQLFWRNNKWFAVTDDRTGRVTEEMCLVGVARCFIKDLLLE
ncbi:hypothetical protein BIT28_07585 [Photobacterium proteolyticum]|uniref:Peptidase S24/S26A/S26B/S26C domain-containing protein n=1 Tax=Photobacterium proteolyticum TaxID=1903952 RepID=A0A1Q9G6G4_9GAMM|nr:hypothetical protein [Photobacterium proteolyticum]OLQ69833.1 hypothetical protein BIT28_07585 [Photobacterium proteolyticum]